MAIGSRLTCKRRLGTGNSVCGAGVKRITRRQQAKPVKKEIRYVCSQGHKTSRRPFSSAPQGNGQSFDVGYFAGFLRDRFFHLKRMLFRPGGYRCWDIITRAPSRQPSLTSQNRIFHP